MAAPKTFAFRGVQDCKIAALSSDTTSAISYGTQYDVPIKGLSCNPEIETYELKHDDLLQELDQQTQSYEIKGTIGRVPLNVLEVFLGGSSAASGSGDAETQTFSHDYDDNPSYFCLETQHTRTFGVEGNLGDSHLKFPKCKVMSLDYNIEDDFVTIEFTAKAIRTINSGNLTQIVANETASSISIS